MAFLDETGLAELWSLINKGGLANEYVWEKLDVKAGWSEKQIAITAFTCVIDGSNANSPTFTFQYANSVSFDASGNVVLVSPTTFTATYSTFASTYSTTLIGKYFTSSSNAITGKIFYMPTNATFGYQNNRQVYVNGTFYRVEGEYDYNAALIGFVNSSNPSAYPINDGYTYNALGRLGQKAQLATGSYTGTGTYGTSTPNSLTFDFTPKYVVVAKSGANTFYSSNPILWWVTPDATVSASTGNNSYAASASLSGNTLSWYNASGASYQLNTSNAVYQYVAIG